MKKTNKMQIFTLISALAAALTAGVHVWRVEAEATKRLETARIERYVDEMETRHGDFVHSMNGYFLIVQKGKNKNEINEFKNRIRSSLSRLKLNKDNWRDLLDSESNAAANEYLDAIAALDGELGKIQSESSWVAFFSLLDNFDNAHNNVLAEIKRQFFGFEKPAESQQEEP